MDKNQNHIYSYKFHTLNSDNTELVKHLLLTSGHCLGMEELVLPEEELDVLLGTRSYSGGSLPSDVIEEIETKTEKKMNEFRVYLSKKLEENAKMLDKLRSIDSSVRWSQEVIEDINWLERWKAFYQPQEINKKIEIIPSWCEADPRKLVSLKIEPGQAFGTGTHETTQGCIEIIHFLHTQGVSPQNILDYGCGSGILGIASEKIFGGSKRITLLDTDSEVENNCKVNLELNNCVVDHYQFHTNQDALLKNQFRYDLILANVLAPILKENVSFFKKKIKSGGYLVLSGILSEQSSDMIRFFQGEQMALIYKIEKGDWVSLALKC